MQIIKILIEIFNLNVYINICEFDLINKHF